MFEARIARSRLYENRIVGGRAAPQPTQASCSGFAATPNALNLDYPRAARGMTNAATRVHRGAWSRDYRLDPDQRTAVAPRIVDGLSAARIVGGLSVCWPNRRLRGPASGISPRARRGRLLRRLQPGNRIPLARNAFYRLPDLASDLVRSGVAVLVASYSTPAVLAARAATTTIPIVFGFGADPVETGLVSSLDHPGGNITGVTSMNSDIGSKRLGLLRHLLPRATRVAVLVDPNDDATVVKSMLADVRGAAIPIGREIEVFYARDVGDIDAAFAGLMEKRSEVLLVSPSSFFSSHRMEIVELAAQHLVPALYFERDFAEAGGLMSYGANIPDQYRLLGIYAGRILNGQKPGDLPVRRA